MDVFDLMAKITLDSSEYERELSGAESKTASFGDKIKSGLGAVAKTITTTAAVTAGAATAAIAGLTKASIDSYAEYEQLSGGIETLFDNTKNLENFKALMKESGATAKEITDALKGYEDPIDTVMNNAANAYKTAGLSANEYMETVTGMAAALNASTGDLAVSANMADMAVTDMADNANKMGSSMESIQNAYSGFAKQNYTMLDNLKLGYGGTKEEMQRLLEDAEKISGFKYDLSSYADIVDAIHVVQTEMGITGTTALEAEQTISGSLAMTKSAWENLITGLANPDADLGLLIDQMVESGISAFDNLIPAIERAFIGIGEAVQKIAPIISERFPALVKEILPSLLSAMTSLIEGLIAALPSLLQVLIDMAPSIIATVITSIMNVIPQLIAVGADLINALVQGITDNLSTILTTATDIISTIWEGITTGLPTLTQKGVEILETLANGIKDNLPTMIEAGLNALMEFSGSLRENVGDLVSAGLDLLLALAQGIIDGLPTMVQTIPTIITNIVGILNDNFPKILAAGVKLLGMLLKGIVDTVPILIAEFPKIIQMILEIWQAVNWLNVGKSVITAIGDGVKALATSVPALIKDIGSKASSFFSSIPWSQVGKDAIAYIILGIKGIMSQVPNLLKTIGNAAVTAMKSIDWISLGQNIVMGVVNGITSFAGKIKDAAVNAAKSAFDGAKSFLGIASPSKKFKWIGNMVGEGFVGGIDDTMDKIADAMGDMTTVFPSDAVIKASTNSGISNSYSTPITINVYGAQGQDINELANIISRKLGNEVRRNQVVWA